MNRCHSICQPGGPCTLERIGSYPTTTADHLRAVIEAWDRWADDYEHAAAGERAMAAAIEAARSHLAPSLDEETTR